MTYSFLKIDEKMANLLEARTRLATRIMYVLFERDEMRGACGVMFGEVIGREVSSLFQLHYLHAETGENIIQACFSSDEKASLNR